MRVRELAEWLGATFEGDGEKELTAVAALESAGAGDVAFVGTRKAAAAAESSAAGCLIWMTALTYAGRKAGDNWHAIESKLHYFDYVVVLAIVIYALLGKLADSLARGMERRWLPWSPEFSRAAT